MEFASIDTKVERDERLVFSLSVCGQRVTHPSPPNPQRKGGESVTTLVIAIVISAVILYGLFKFRDKEAHHLDGLHIVGSAHSKKH